MESEEIVKSYQNKYLLSTPLYTDMGGGLNVRVSPPEMKVNQSMVCKNVIYNAASGALRPRDGTIKLIDAVFPLPALEDIWGIFQAPFSNGRATLVGTSLKVWAFESPNWTDITGTAVRTAPVSKKINWAFYTDLAIGVDGTNAPFKVSNTLTASPLGPVAPVCKFVTVWNDYVVMAGDGTNKVYYSDKQDPTSWPVENYLVAGGDTDGDPITGIAVAYGSLIIFKRNSIYAVSGTTSSDFSLSQIGRSVGLVSDGAHCNADNDVWFLGPSGMWHVGSDLTPKYMSDYVMPRYQTIISNLMSDNTNLPSVVYNSSKQQVWISVDYNGDGVHDRVLVHDLINLDSSSRPAVSEYYFYDGGTSATNYNPRFLANYLQSNNEPRIISMNRNNYVYLHDAPIEEGATGDDGNSVQWEWQSKMLNLGDPMRLKTLRYYTVMGDSLGGQPAASNRNYAYSVADDEWTAKTPMSYPRRGCAVVAVGGKIYCAGGYNGTDTVAYLESYDPGTDAWTTLASMPSAVAYGAMVTDGTDLYYMGGYNSGSLAYSKKLYKFTVATGVWSTLADMGTARYFLGAAYYNGNIYAFGGWAGSVALNVNEAYDISAGTWSTKTSPAAGRYLLTSSVVNGKIYHIGGFPQSRSTWNEMYDPATDSWTTKSSMSQGRYEHSAAVVSGKIYLLGGYWNGVALSDTVMYDPVADTYTSKASMLSTRYWGGADAVSGVVYVVGGNGLPATMSFVISDDFTNMTTVSFDLTLNTRREIPATANYQKRFWAINLKGAIVEGVVQITGWNLDYTMFQRRN